MSSMWMGNDSNGHDFKTVLAFVSVQVAYVGVA